MKVLVAHNSYQHAGGEDAVFDNEARLLRQSGHEVREYLDDNHRIAEFSSTRLGIETLWSRSSYKKLSAVLAEFRPNVVHFHNTFPLISPSVYYAARNHSVPVVQTLHNYRLFCPAAAFFRDGKVCEDCLDKSRWQAVRHACYRQSRSASSAVAAMLSFHHWYGTWKNLVNCYIALSEFSRAKFIEAGLPPEKIVVKPNFVLPDPGVGPGSREYAVFLGRLSEEKGLRTLVQAWAHVNRNCPLRVIGEGPLLN
ncbi:MAG: glycosyl transferase family 1, partial [Acidobacteria bacterium]